METDYEKLFIDNTPLVYFLINKYYPTFIGNEDIAQEGKIGLWVAILNYDETKGKASTYYSTCIHNALRSAISKEMSTNGILSLDYEYDNDSTFGEGVVGDSDVIDVSYLDATDFIETLTEREKTVCKLTNMGYNQSEIGEMLDYSYQSVGQIQRSIKNKWRVYNYDE